MNFNINIGILFFSFLILSVCLISTFKIQKKAASSVRPFIAAVLFIHIDTFLLIAYNSDCIANIAFVLYFIAIDWTLLSLFFFCSTYTKYIFYKDAVHKVLTTLTILDSISLLFNFKFHHVFKITNAQLIFTRGELYITTYWGFTLHFTIIFIILAFSFGILIYKIISTPFSYFHKYIFIGLFVFISIIFDLLHIFESSDPILPIIGYSFSALLVYYFSFFYVPKRLLEYMLSQVISNFSDAMIFCDIDNTCIYMNDAALNLLGLTENKIYLSQEILKIWVNNPHLGEISDDFTCFCSRMVNNKLLHLQIDYHNVYNNKNKRISSYYQIIDKTESVDILEKQRYLAIHDTVTGVYNTTHFFKVVRDYIEEFPQFRYLAVVVSINQFKLINDVFGSFIGDDVLHMTATGLKKLSKKHEILYGRVSSNKFGFLIKRNEFKDLEIKELFTNLADNYNKIYYPIVYKIGIYEITDDRIPITLMFEHCIQAIESLKNNYNHQITKYSQHLDRQLLWEKEVSEGITNAINNNELLLYLQPQVTKDDLVVGAEVLVRWQHLIKGLLYPNQFIPILEKTGTIIELDKFMWESSCKLLSDWKKEGRKNQLGDDLYLSLNISPMDFYFLDVHSEFIRLTKKYDLSPHTLRLEITEDVLMKDIDRKISVVQKLKNDGFTIEIDNFGNSYTFLNILKDLPIDVLKLEMSFLYETREPEKNHSILEHLIHLVRELGLTVITEGIEVKEQVPFLSKMGCDLFQGFYFSTPLPADEFEAKYTISTKNAVLPSDEKEL
ncbi:EAL domain-containing protein [Lachnobacterium bovis]|uniref:Diguanylate cyclase (GGDEF) domain-containing protein n=1 Tax=Lachnobacterium bovis TaxID=140626 RepID=A0A1H9RRH4_9FIRM|nr:EAL domain-containing protein [Lachnobacterium bovis]SER75257.1 diguanylate cyclase (GGDEF) domain-containing protein [Lachnobacterium bovis]